jgi:CelD/BcsL family acetyltransferase involved in cellulose biosynthesis
LLRRAKGRHETHPFAAVYIRADELGCLGWPVLLRDWEERRLVEKQSGTPTSVCREGRQKPGRGLKARDYMRPEDSMSIDVEIIDTSEQFMQLRDEWNALLESSASNCIFLTHEWLSTWWKHLADQRRLLILTARDSGQLVGIMPLSERPAQVSRMMPRSYEFVGSGIIGSDYLDMIASKGQEPEVACAFAQQLNRTGVIVQLSQLRSENCVVSLLAEYLKQDNWTVMDLKQNICPYIDLRGHTWDTYLSTVGSNLRKNVNRYIRNLPRDFEMRLLCAQSQAEAQLALEALIDLHHKRWGAKGESEAFQSASSIAFHREFADIAAEHGWLRILVLYLNETPAAALYGWFYGSVFYFYQSGFDPAYNRNSVGVATMALSIKTAMEEGATEYDFLHGDEEYKFHWTRQTRDLGRLELYPPLTRANIYRHAISLNRVARRMARRVLNKAR